MKKKQNTKSKTAVAESSIEEDCTFGQKSKQTTHKNENNQQTKANNKQTNAVSLLFVVSSYSEHSLLQREKLIGRIIIGWRPNAIEPPIAPDRACPNPVRLFGRRPRPLCRQPHPFVLLRMPDPGRRSAKLASAQAALHEILRCLFQIFQFPGPPGTHSRLIL